MAVGKSGLRFFVSQSIKKLVFFPADFFEFPGPSGARVAKGPVETLSGRYLAPLDLRTRPEVKIVRYCFLDLQFSRRGTAARLPDHLSILPALRLSLLRPPYPAQAVAPDHGLVGLEVHTGQLRHVQRRPRQPRQARYPPPVPPRAGQLADIVRPHG